MLNALSVWGGGSKQSFLFGPTESACNSRAKAFYAAEIDSFGDAAGAVRYRGPTSKQFPTQPKYAFVLNLPSCPIRQTLPSIRATLVVVQFS
eukprot:10588498-Lingulodinium_polyedra.AAC.1